VKIEDFVLERVTIEVRYPKTFLFWDHVGTFWTGIEKDWPTITDVEADPAKTVFRLDPESSYELVAELAAARIVAHSPKGNLDELKKVAANFFTRLCELMNIQYFNRVGFRLIFFLSKDSFAESKDLVNQAALVQLPAGRALGLDMEGAWTETAVLLASEDLGARIRLAPRTRNLDVTPPLGFGLERIKREEHGVLFDVDYYTMSLVDIAQIEFQDWISNAYHLIKRDSEKFLAKG